MTKNTKKMLYRKLEYTSDVGRFVFFAYMRCPQEVVHRNLIDFEFLKKCSTLIPHPTLKKVKI